MAEEEKEGNIELLSKDVFEKVQQIYIELLQKVMKTYSPFDALENIEKIGRSWKEVRSAIELLD